MTRRLRAVHARWWLVLGPLAAVVVLVALAARPERPVQEAPAAMRGPNAPAAITTGLGSSP
jgi:hypothetical protein